MNPTTQLIEPEIRELLAQGEWACLRETLGGLPAADVADILAEIPASEAAKAFRFLPRDQAAEVFSYLMADVQNELIEKLGADDSVALVEAMSADDRVRLVDELPEHVAQRIVGSLSPEQRRITQAILGYPPRSVGRLMTPDYVRVRPEWTVAYALDHIRRYGRDAETLNVVYVIDDLGKLVDDVRLRQLLLAAPEQTVESLMNRVYYSLQADQPQSDAVEMMKKYDRAALPVVDSRGVLLGIVTHDDVADVAEQQATEQVQMLGGVQVLEEPFDQASAASLVKKRAPWLALLFLSEVLTTNALSQFQGQIERAAVLATFVPAIISSGGNSGSQASTLVIRALALGEITLRDWWRVLRREFLVAAVLGVIVAGLGFTRINLWGMFGWWVEKEVDAGGNVILNTRVQDHYTLLGVAIATSLIGVVVWGSVMGSMLPFILKKLKLDPAGSSTPFVATLVDVTGIMIYFTVAMSVLRGTIL